MKEITKDIQVRYSYSCKYCQGMIDSEMELEVRDKVVLFIPTNLIKIDLFMEFNLPICQKCLSKKLKGVST